MDIAAKIGAFADSLDRAGLSRLADNVDQVLAHVVKTAQYVGSQGYWVRNERCWANCYRQKRASTPSKPAQEVWFECQQEYQDSLSGDKGWDKYAGSDRIIKTASFIQADRSFAKLLAQRMASGESAGLAAFKIISAQRRAVSDRFVDAAGQMLRLAQSLDGVEPSLATEAGQIANGLLKLALPNWMKPWGKSKSRQPSLPTGPVDTYTLNLPPGGELERGPGVSQLGSPPLPPPGGAPVGDGSSSNPTPGAYSTGTPSLTPNPQPKTNHPLVAFLNSFGDTRQLGRRVSQWTTQQQNTVWERVKRHVAHIVAEENRKFQRPREEFNFSSGVGGNLSNLPLSSPDTPSAPAPSAPPATPAAAGAAPLAAAAMALNSLQKLAQSGKSLRPGTFEARVLEAVKDAINLEIRRVSSPKL
jgi:hypothetical protein